MSNGVIAKRYALALVTLAAKEKQIDEVAQGLEVLAQGIQTPKSKAFVADPKLTRTQKSKVMEAMATQGKVTALLGTAVQYLAHKGRLELLPDISLAYQSLADERMGRAAVEVTVSEKLSSEQQQGIQRQYERLTGKKLTLTVKVDPDILGGVITKIGSTVRDGSLANQLHQLRAAIIQGKVE